MYLDKSEEKFTILYTVKEYDAPLDVTRLYEIMTWENQVMDYFELSEILYELSEDGYIEKKFYRNNEAYILTPSGEETLKLFSSRIPVSVVNRINRAIEVEKYDELVSPDSIRADVIFSEKGDYILKCDIVENKETQMELSVNYGGAKLSAMIAAERIKKDGKEILGEILKILEK